MFSSRYTNPYYCRSIICHSPLPCHSPCHSPVKCHNSPLRCLSARKADSPRRDIPVSQNLSLRMSPERRFSPVRCCFVCHATPCCCCVSCHYYPCRCCITCHSFPCCCCIRCHVFPCCCTTIIQTTCHSPICHSPCHSPCRSPCRSPCKTTIRSTCQETNYRPIKYNPNEYEETQFKSYLTEVMNAENAIESAKIDLALRCDFNCEDAFRIFELNGRGFLTPEDIRFGLNLLDIYATDTDINLLMKKYDLGKCGFLNYQTFFDMIIPYEKEYRNMVENRLPNSCCSCRCPEVFTCTTRLYLKNLFNLIIERENKLNCMRRGYNTLKLKLTDIFGLIDILRIGYFTVQDLLRFLKLNGIYIGDKACDLLFIRLDPNRSGRVEYFNLNDEMKSLY